MIIFLILGILLGVISVVFVLQNITPVTVTFFAMQMQGSLALMLFLAMLSGVLMTLLFLLPTFIRDSFHLSRISKRARALEDELTATKAVAAARPTPPVIPPTPHQ